jgi:hypothetical protein
MFVELVDPLQSLVISDYLRVKRLIFGLCKERCVCGRVSTRKYFGGNWISFVLRGMEIV